MAEPDDMIIPMLRQMRDEANAFQKDMRDEFEKVNKRLDKLEAAQKSFRHALTADTMMSKFITGDFEERTIALERHAGIDQNAD